jgi:hypothetical protein
MNINCFNEWMIDYGLWMHACRNGRWAEEWSSSQGKAIIYPSLNPRLSPSLLESKWLCCAVLVSNVAHIE